MNIQLLYRKALYFLAFVLALGMVTSCASDKSKSKDSDEMVTIDSLEIDEQLIQDVKTVKEIFYSLPSPLETAMILKQAGAKYNEELLNPTKNASRYVTNKSMALNLGIYTTDLSYASLFDQTQATISYMNASKKMAEGLGILNAIDEDIIERLEANINNRDVIMDIISETIMNSSSFFEENDRQAMSVIVLVGGWIEGLYIATQLVTEADFEGNKLVDRIVEQKLSFDILEKLLEQHANDEEIQALNEELSGLREVFGKIKIRSTPVTAEKDEVTNVTELKSQIDVEFSPEVFNELKETVKNLRSNFIL